MFSQQASKPKGSHSRGQSIPTQSEVKTNTSPSLSPGSVPSISLPKGGGAIASMGEKFDVNAATGTATLSIPLATSAARGLEPNLSLEYSSRNGNGAFGLGWALSLASITRKTEKGIPCYQDAVESDVFLLAGVEDLVPIFKRNEIGDILIDHATGNPVYQDEVRGEYVIRRYSPRVDQSFVRIEKWTKGIAPNIDIHWRTISPENVTTIYGSDDNSRVYDPNVGPEGQRVFSWLIAETYDTAGNAVIYKYKAEDSIRVCLEQPHEVNRTNKSRSPNRYIKSIQYGNTSPNRDQMSWKAFSAFGLPEHEWMFTVAFDYGEYDTDFPQLEDDAPWFSRKDPFSSYRSGFEIRTYRLCRRILMFHHFPSHLNRHDYLVNSTNITYDETPAFAYLQSASHVGYLLDDSGTRYHSKSLPPLEFEYSKFPSDHELSLLQAKEIDPESLQNIPYGMDGSNYQWVDLDGEGLPGVLTEQATGWFYKRNLSANNLHKKSSDVEGETIPKLAPIVQVCQKPVASLSAGRSFFADVRGDGLMDLVNIGNGRWGFYSRQFAEGQATSWTPLQEFKSFPNINTNSADIRFMDLTGDGLPDIVMTEDQAFLWFPSLGADGYGKGHRSPQSFDEKNGPKLVFDDPEETIYLADMSGDGLTDLVRVRIGEICYWPNTGYGSFGAKVTMDNSPLFAEYSNFDQQYVRLVDIDGSGTTDIIYIGSDEVDIYLNQAGNGFSDRKRLPIFTNSSLSTVAAIDLLGTGTISLVWSSVLPGDSRMPMKYIDITNGKNLIC